MTFSTFAALTVLLAVSCLANAQKQSDAGTADRPDPKTSGSIGYINPNVSNVKRPAYRGRRYQAVVPATLDVAERAGFVLHALTEMVNPNSDCEPYFHAELLAKPPYLFPHAYADTTVWFKFMRAMPLMRTMSGSQEHPEREQMMIEALLKTQGQDGLIYHPLRGRPWGHNDGYIGTYLTEKPKGDQISDFSYGTSGALMALCYYAQADPNGQWRTAANRLAAGLKQTLVHDREGAYHFQMSVEPNWQWKKPTNPPKGIAASTAAWTALALSTHNRLLGGSKADDASLDMVRYLLRSANLYGKNGELEPGQATVHFYTIIKPLMAALDVTQATGNREFLPEIIAAFDRAVAGGNDIIGYFPEYDRHAKQGYILDETCCNATMIMAGLKLCDLGFDRWDAVDRWVRNHFAENQILHTEWTRFTEPDPKRVRDAGLYITNAHVAERCLGAFAGWSSANDLDPGNTGEFLSWGWSLQTCCVANGALALYDIWQHILQHDGSRLRVNLLLNRASRWVDIHSHIPYAGQVDFVIKEELNLEARLPAWVSSEKAVCTVNGKARPLQFDGCYAQMGRVGKGDRVTLTFPLTERKEKIIVQKTAYTVVLRGNDVVQIDPPGKNLPLYQRSHFRAGQTLWKKIERFVPTAEIQR